MENNKKLVITTEDIVEANLHLINSHVMEASMALEQEKRIKSLAMAYINIGKTLNLMGFDPASIQH